MMRSLVAVAVCLVGSSVLAQNNPPPGKAGAKPSDSLAGLANTRSQSAIGNPAPPFPGGAESWLNSGPIAVESLKGKGVVVFFFDPNSNAVRGRWPLMFETTKKFQGKPVIFIAVVPDEARPVIGGYAQQVGLQWPVFVDTGGALARAYGVGEISAMNDAQLMMITPKADVARGDWRDFERSTQSALVGAEWTVDPAKIPEALKPAWFAVEFGDPNAAASAIKKGLTSSEADVKQGAELLKAAVQARIEKQTAEAKKALDEGRKFDAFSMYSALADGYKAFELPAEVAAKRKELLSDPEVKSAMTAKRSLDAAKKLIASGKPTVKKQAATMLRKVVQDAGNSSIGKEAEELLQSLGGM
jgi:peroxiredoxin